MDGTENLPALREEFPILRNSAYLVSHSMGAMPRRALRYLQEYGEEWSTRGLAAYERWLPMILEMGNLIGRILHAPKDSVILHQNVSILSSIVLSAVFHPRGRRKIVTTELNFPSVHYNWLRNRAWGLEVEIVRSPDGITIPQDVFERAIDERTLLVVIDHGIFRSGFLQDAGALCRRARSVGAYSFVDAYQTVGCVPIDVQAWGCDFLVGGSHKWLCGGPGAAYLYVRPEIVRTLEPRITGWFSHKRPFAFEMEMDFADNAMRFATGTPGIPALYAARAGIETILEVGVERIRAQSVRMTQEILERARDEGFRLHSPRDPRQRSGMVCIDFPGAERAEAELMRQGIHVDYRPRCGIRLSAHFYTTQEEIDTFFDAARKLRRRR